MGLEGTNVNSKQLCEIHYSTALQKGKHTVMKQGNSTR